MHSRSYAEEKNRIEKKKKTYELQCFDLKNRLVINNDVYIICISCTKIISNRMIELFNRCKDILLSTAE